jgi:hypothetical protein
MEIIYQIDYLELYITGALSIFSLLMILSLIYGDQSETVRWQFLCSIVVGITFPLWSGILILVSLLVFCLQCIPYTIRGLMYMLRLVS